MLNIIYQITKKIKNTLITVSNRIIKNKAENKFIIINESI